MAQTRRLANLGLDVIGVAGGETEVLLHDRADARLLSSTGLPATYVDASAQLARLDQARAQEARLASQAEQDPALRSDLPTGRVSYRTLDEAQAEMRRIAREHPDIVRLVRLPERSLLETPVFALEISRDVRVDSGEPVFLTTGVHHAREWPTLEFTLEFAWEVAQNYGKDPRITALVDSTHMIVVPVVNPDGFDISRERIYEMKRKNCRVEHGEIPTYEQCADPANHALGVDLNRNYGSFWGGPGSSSSVTASNHHGQAPYSEPEIRNMSDVLTSNQVMVAVNNHTPDGLLLRAPSSPLEPTPAEVEAYDGLAQQLGDALGWPAGPWTEIYYYASGVAEQEGLYATGTFGFTPELTPGHSGLDRFHPPYEYVVDQYLGTDFYHGSSIREALLRAWEAAADPSLHSVIEGTAPAGTELTISRDVTVDSSPLETAEGDTRVLTSPLTLESKMVVPENGRFAWHVLPSLRQSQYASELRTESWTVSCPSPGGHIHDSAQVTIARGQSTQIDMSGCPQGPVDP